MFTHKAMGGEAFVLSDTLLLFLFPEFDLEAASLIAMAVGSLCWLMLSYLATRMNGLWIEFQYSKNGLGLWVMTLWRGLKNLGHIEIDMSLYNLGKPTVNETQVIAKLNYFFEQSFNALTSAQIVHFVGCQKDNAEKECNVLSFLTSVKR